MSKHGRKLKRSVKSPQFQMRSSTRMDRSSHREPIPETQTQHKDQPESPDKSRKSPVAKAVPAGSPPIFKLPLEIMRNICDRLDPRSLGKLALTSKHTILHTAALESFWEAPTINLANYFDLQNIMSNENVTKSGHIVSYTKHLTLIVEGRRSSKPAVVKACILLLKALRCAVKIESLIFKDSQLNLACWYELARLFTSKGSRIRRTIRRVVFPHMNTAAMVEWNADLWRKRGIEDLKVGTFQWTGGFSFVHDRNPRRRFSFEVQGAQPEIWPSLLPQDFNPNDEIYKSSREKGFGTNHALANACAWGIIGAHGRTPFEALICGWRFPSWMPDLDTSRLQRLIFKEVYLNPRNMVDINLASLKHLELIRCSHHELLYNFLRRSTEHFQFKLTTFSCTNDHGSGRDRFTPFLDSWEFHKHAAFIRDLIHLKKFHFHASSAKVSHANAFQFSQNRHSMEDLSIRLGDRPLSFFSLSRIRVHCPNLKALGFNWDFLNIPVEQLESDIPLSLHRGLQRFAREILHFKRLESLRIFLRPFRECEPDIFRHTKIIKDVYKSRLIAKKIWEYILREYRGLKQADESFEVVGLRTIVIETSLPWQRDPNWKPPKEEVFMCPSLLAPV